MVWKDSSVQAVKISRDTGEIVAYYRTQFEKLYGANPEIDDDDTQVAVWLAQAKSTAEAQDLISLYLNLPNKWVREQGYPLRLLRKFANAAYVNSSSVENQGSKLRYVVGFSDSGGPVTAHNPNILRDGNFSNFKATLWDDWQKLPLREKLQNLAQAYIAAGYDVPAWVERWKTEGWVGREEVL